MKRILHLRSSGGLLGAENVIIELCKHAKENSSTAIIGAIKNIKDPYPEFLNCARELSIENVVFSCRNQFDLRCSKSIKKYIYDNNIDILHTHGYKEDFYAILSNVKIPKIATNHLWKKSNLKDRLYCLMDSFFLRYFDHVIGVSEEIVNELRQKKINNTSKIVNGIDIKKYSISKKAMNLLGELNIPNSSVIIGMISSITPEKGHETALKAFAEVLKHRCENVKLLIVGEGSEVAKLKKMSIDLNIEKQVIFVGKRTDIPEILSILDIFLITSLTEGLPMALLEAMAAGKVVISTDVGEIPYVIQNNINGILIKPNDFEKTANAIATVLCADFSKTYNLGINASITVRENYSSETMTKKYSSLYDSLVEKHSVSRLKITSLP